MSGIKKLEKIIEQKRSYCLQQIQQYLSVRDKGQDTTKPSISPQQEDKLMIAAFMLISDCFMQLTQFCLGHYGGFPNAQELKHKLSLNKQKMEAIKKKIAQNQFTRPKTEVNKQIEKKKEPVISANQQISGYLVFFKEKSKEISNVQLQSTSHKVSFISNLWSNMSSEQRQRYEQKALKIKMKKTKKNNQKQQSKSANQNGLNGHQKHEKAPQNAASKPKNIKNSNFHHPKPNIDNKTKPTQAKDFESSGSQLQSDILSDSLQDRQKQFDHTDKPISKKVSKTKPKILSVMYKQH